MWELIEVPCCSKSLKLSNKAIRFPVLDTQGTEFHKYCVSSSTGIMLGQMNENSNFEFSIIFVA